MTLWQIGTGLVFGLAVLVPLGLKWELQKGVFLPAVVLIALTSAVIVGMTIAPSFSILPVLSFEILLMVAMAASLLLWRFYRDPERIPPDEPNLVLSPADGKVIYVKAIKEGEIPVSEKNGKSFELADFTHTGVLPQEGHLIGIALTYLDVHVNRAPTAGTVDLVKHIKGLYLSLKKKEAVFMNERMLMVINNGQFKLGIALIASRLVRRIVSYIEEKQRVELGQRIGMIRFGSQVDLVLPDLPTLEIEVQAGDRVIGGESIVARF